MAGRGSRFASAGFVQPKPLIPIGGRPMIEWVIGNIRPARPHRFIFIAQATHLAAHPEVRATLERLCPGAIFVTTDTVTEGAACTVLLARQHIDGDAPLMIANADQYVDLPVDDYLARMDQDRLDGLIMTFYSDHPKWSFCRINAAGLVTEVVEKKVVSNEATVGIYNFRRGGAFVAAADSMIAQNLRVNNEFYVAPAYNQLITAGDRVGVARTGQEYQGMYGLGTPEDLAYFKVTPAYSRGRLTATAEDEPCAIARARIRILNGFLERGVEPGIHAMTIDPVRTRLRDPACQELLRAAAEAPLETISRRTASLDLKEDEFRWVSPPQPTQPFTLKLHLRWREQVLIDLHHDLK
jgi:NDP-sugar pyrophosphorylase family protein